MRFAQNLLLGLTLYLCILLAQGFPQYSSSDYDEEYGTDYGNEEYDTKEANVDAKDLSEYNPQMSTKSKTIEVDAGTTIRLNCDIENLNPELNQYVMWKRENSANTILSTGDTVIPEDYKPRTKVKFSEKGSVLTIAVATAEDAGRYMCKLQLPGNTQSVTHIVIVRGTAVSKIDSPATLNLNEGDEMKLTCTATAAGSDQKANIYWSKQGGLLPNGESEEESSELTVDNVKLQDAGIYVCTAADQNGKSQVHKTVKVTVLETSQEANSAKQYVSQVCALTITTLIAMFL